MRIEKMIQITLKSELCIGSGYSYAGLIDSDICYDKYGIPFIPARRIKGCMREVAETVLYSFLSEKEINDFFGISGSNGVYGITVENAYIENYEEICKELQQIEQEPIFQKYINKQDILESFTHIKAQTKMKDGVAKDLSLRYTRTIKQHSPIDKKNITFYSKLYFDNANFDPKEEEKLDYIVQAIRSIGINRNRGLGNIQCKLVSTKCGDKQEQMQTLINTLPTQKDKQEWVISYTIENKAPLMLSASSNDTSEKQINGSNVLGFLAGKYLSLPNTSPEDKTFWDIFLKGKVKFTNVTIKKENRNYYPAPANINRLKKTKKLVNTEFCYNDKMGEDYNADHGNQPKKLKGKYISYIKEKNCYDVAEVDTSIVYHHSHRGESRQEEEGILYHLEAIQQNQQFSGKIYTPQKYKDLLCFILKQGEMYFGKSKSAQYGKCILKDLESRPFEQKKMQFKKGDNILVTLLSDGIFIKKQSNDYCDYTIYYDDVYNQIAEGLNIKVQQSNEFYSMLQTKLVYGYQSTRNLRKAPIPAISAGSVFAYCLKEDGEINKEWIGERNLEGYGHIRVEILDSKKNNYNLEENEVKKIETENKTLNLFITKELIKDIILKALQQRLKLEILKNKKINISPSTLGRVTLMLQESLDEQKNDTEKAFQNFINRVETIKRESERKEIRTELLEKIADKKEENKSSKEPLNWEINDNKLLSVGKEKIEKIEEVEEIKLLKAIGYQKHECKKMINSIWAEFLMTVLTHQKYLMKEELDCETKN